MLLLAAMAGGPATVAPPEEANVSIQIVNPQAGTALRLRLDRSVIFEGVPTGATIADASTVPAVVGTFALAAGTKHVLVAEVPGTATKAQLEWTPRQGGSAWLVVRYDPGRQAPEAPPFFTFALQGGRYKAR